MSIILKQKYNYVSLENNYMNSKRTVSHKNKAGEPRD